MTTHRRAFLFAIGLTLFTGFFTIFRLRSFLPHYLFLSSLYFPVLAGRSFSELGLRESIAIPLGFILGGLSYILLPYFLARFWLESPRYLKRTLETVCAFGGIVVWFCASQEPVDWTSRGLDPDHPGFKPATVTLAGTFEDTYRNPSYGPRRKGRFEIRMRGYDCYYCRKWLRTDWSYGDFDAVELIIGEFQQCWSVRNRGTGIGGGGGSWVAPGDLVLARRLWNGDVFVGVQPDTPLVLEGGHTAEVFLGTKRVGPYTIPREIHFTRSHDLEQTFTIKKVEFSSLPGREWFDQVKRKHFDRDPSLWKLDLGEPGIKQREW